MGLGPIGQVVNDVYHLDLILIWHGDSNMLICPTAHKMETKAVAIIGRWSKCQEVKKDLLPRTGCWWYIVMRDLPLSFSKLTNLTVIRSIDVGARW